MKVSSPKLILLLYFLYTETYKGKVYGDTDDQTDDHFDDGGDLNKDKSRCGFKKPDKKRWKLIKKRCYKEKNKMKWYTYMYDKWLDKNFDDIIGDDDKWLDKDFDDIIGDDDKWLDKNIGDIIGDDDKWLDKNIGDIIGDDNKAGGNKGDGNKEDGNKGGGNKGDGNKGDGNKGDGNKGDGNKGDGNKGDDNKGGGNKGDGDKGDGNKGTNFNKDKNIEKNRYLNADHTSIGTVDIDVYWHIIHKISQEGKVSEAIIDDQMIVLNNAFSGGTSNDCNDILRPSNPTPFRFVKKLTNYEENNDWFRNQDNEDNQKEMKEKLRQGGCESLNIYTRGGGGGSVLGLASFPDECELDVIMDGVMIDYRTLPEGQYFKFNEGNTLVHEVGHWLGLLHTHEGGCDDEDGDSVADTPAEGSSSSGCAVGRDTCVNDPGVDSIHNFMSYSDDCCMNQFTIGQVERMTQMAGQYRLAFDHMIFTDSPTQTPNVIECLPDEKKVTITLFTDDWADETSFKLTNQQNIAIISEPQPGIRFTSKTQYVYETCVSYGPYTFEINDAGEIADGICCEPDDCYYSVEIDEKEVARGCDFTSAAVNSFVVSDNACKEFFLTIETDNSVNETSWELETSNGNVIMEGGNYGNNELHVYKKCLLSPFYYNFAIKDSGKDGICCAAGIGNYELSFDGELVAKGGMFGKKTAHVVGDCQEGYFKFSLEIKTDNNPSETSWKLSRLTRKKIAKGKGYNERKKQFFYDTCLKSSKCYEFTIKDKGRDGFQNDKAWYEIKIDGVKIKKESNFKRSSISLIGSSCRVGSSRNSNVTLPRINTHLSLELADPSIIPSVVPSIIPSTIPSADPSTIPTTNPSANPSTIPNTIPSSDPSANPSTIPSTIHNADPSISVSKKTSTPTIFLCKDNNKKPWTKRIATCKSLQKTYRNPFITKTLCLDDKVKEMCQHTFKDICSFNNKVEKDHGGKISIGYTENCKSLKKYKKKAKRRACKGKRKSNCPETCNLCPAENI